ncbi:2-amino-4-hydroxy-6-hydroxymethyldihydropteridine diphosphokinase [Saccharicrinis aurantiacus]|uniref:2-amino-4-hydroxy-6- hydroxymethyldihydropteridine diphosphokinase n=1 Tax=Saccharicrinis aurantiacus TaxID=1849719 RepID=UPI000838F944|nr:2-amino-4-hydroxy-6-hydroxymethyldihydropteridine diphosphokinase [Saccharicrinis aurantiacus]
MHRVILLLGGNLGDIKTTLKHARDLLSNEIGDVIKQSKLYESEPWGFEHAQNFLNQVIEIETAFSARELLDATQNIERELGRKQKTSTHYEGRLIDIDILFFDDIIVDESDLIIPHPHLHERLFTLLPLNELWSDFNHPLLKKSISELSDECEDKCWARKLK